MIFDSLPLLPRLMIRVILFTALALGGGIAGITVADAVGGTKAADFANVQFSSPQGQTLYAYLNINPSTEATIILLPDSWGLNTEHVWLANWLADRGYSVLALDPYRGQATGVIFRKWLLTLTTPDTQILADTAAAYTYLQQNHAAQAARIGIIGFERGGQLAVTYAMQQRHISAAVNVYGPMPQLPDHSLHNPIQGIFAASQTHAAQQMEASLLAADVPHEIIVYTDTNIGFLRFPQVSVTNTPAARAFDDIIAFMDKHITSAGDDAEAATTAQQSPNQ